MSTKELLGKRLRELRKKRSLTLEQLAEKADVDVKYLGNIERGRENPTIGTLEKVGNALSVKLYQIVTFEHEITGQKLLRRRIVQLLDKCEEKDLQTILQLINAIKD